MKSLSFFGGGKGWGLGFKNLLLSDFETLPKCHNLF